jgi:signal transduction histidine kinase
MDGMAGRARWLLAPWPLMCVVMMALAPLLLVPLPAAAAPSARGDELIAQRMLFTDPSARMSVDEVAAQPESALTPVPAVFARGYKADALWLRITLVAGAPADTVLKVQPTHLNDVQLYDRSASGPDASAADASGAGGSLWRQRQQGSRWAFDDRERQELAFAFKLRPLTEPAATVVWLRVASQSALNIGTFAVRDAQAAAADTRLHLLFGGYAGVVAMLALASAVQAVKTRDKLWIASTLFHLASLCLGVMYLGLGHKYLWPGAPLTADLWTMASGCLHHFFGVLLFWLIYVTFNAPRWYVAAVGLLLLALPLQLWWLSQGQVREAMSLNGQMLLWGAVVAVVMVWFMPIQDRLMLWLLRLNMGVTLGYLVWFMGSQLGAWPGVSLQLYPALPVNLATGLLLYQFLIRRDVLAARAREADTQQLALTQKELSLEKRRVDQSSQFMAMLLHELKTPLASIRLAAMNLRNVSVPGLPVLPVLAAVGPAAAPVLPQASLPARAQLTAGLHERRLAAIDHSVLDIDAVLDRCRLADQMGQGSLRPLQATRLELGGFLRERMAAARAPERLRVAVEPDFWVQADPLLLRIMVDNLMENALLYSPQGSGVQLACRRTAWVADAGGSDGRGPANPGAVRLPEAAFELTVSNEVGKAGVPDAGRLFERYYRAPAAHHCTGSGLGLYLVRSLARMGGGEVGYALSPRASTSTSDGAVPPAQRVVMTLSLPC